MIHLVAGLLCSRIKSLQYCAIVLNRPLFLHILLGKFEIGDLLKHTEKYSIRDMYQFIQL